MEQKQEEIAIAVDHISKVYKLYDKPMDRMVEALGLTKKKENVWELSARMVPANPRF